MNSPLLLMVWLGVQGLATAFPPSPSWPAGAISGISDEVREKPADVTPNLLATVTDPESGFGSNLAPDVHQVSVTIGEDTIDYLVKRDRSVGGHVYVVETGLAAFAYEKKGSNYQLEAAIVHQGGEICIIQQSKASCRTFAADGFLDYYELVETKVEQDPSFSSAMEGVRYDVEVCVALDSYFMPPSPSSWEDAAKAALHYVQLQMALANIILKSMKTMDIGVVLRDPQIPTDGTVTIRGTDQSDSCVTLNAEREDFHDDLITFADTYFPSAQSQCDHVMVITGAQLLKGPEEDLKSRLFSKEHGVCNSDGRSLSVYEGRNEDLFAAMAYDLLISLGASPITDQEQITVEGTSLMTQYQGDGTGQAATQISMVTENQISANIYKVIELVGCLQKTNQPTASLFTTAVCDQWIHNGYSLQEQCRLWTGDPQSEVIENGPSGRVGCSQDVYCSTPSDPYKGFLTGIIRPLDASPCSTGEKDGICSSGQCVTSLDGNGIDILLSAREAPCESCIGIPYHCKNRCKSTC